MFTHGAPTTLHCYDLMLCAERGGHMLGPPSLRCRRINIMRRILRNLEQDSHTSPCIAPAAAVRGKHQLHRNCATNDASFCISTGSLGANNENCKLHGSWILNHKMSNPSGQTKLRQQLKLQWFRRQHCSQCHPQWCREGS